jgi:hypothetical protein
MTTRRPTTADLGGRTEAEYAALADWAENNLPDLTGQVIHSGEDSRAEARAMLAACLPDDPAKDGPAEAFARAELRRHVGRPNLDPAAAPGQHSVARQVRLPDPLDDRLSGFVRAHDTSRSAVMRTALEQYLERQLSDLATPEQQQPD